MNGGARYKQLSRIFATPIEDDEAARSAISARPGDFASALFLEAAASDDVIGRESALDYLAGRLTFFDGLISDTASSAVVDDFKERLRAWES
ncbi:MAG: hypothetical protein ABI305_14280 [Tepidiformaceae bacterium]